jgi:hypothetical protein
MRAIDILKAESNLSTLKRHILRFSSGTTLEIFTTPVTLAERKIAGDNAKSDETLEVNLALLVLKAKDTNGEPAFNAGDIPQLRRFVSAEYVAELVSALYKMDTDEETDVSPKPSAPNSDKITN